MEDLRIADFTYEVYKSSLDINDLYLMYFITDEYAKPNGNNSFEYLPTQFISELIKSIGFDGIKYNSSLYLRGRNYVIFNYQKCKAISSKLYQLEDICYEAKCVGPVGDLLGINDLVHWKLDGYKKATQKDLIKHIKSLNPKQSDMQ